MSLGHVVHCMLSFYPVRCFRVPCPLLLLLQDEWVSAGMALSIFGCFAMTELRGGSFVRGIETVRVA